ncbi:M23 family metallopeptidase [Aliisedimentitalea scapharcae]|uniref:M23 family metallopeptidase n=1 Tax=Aliisedimentitalea scapharcae TaxID=1524259 RepID=A0ABZ2XWM4_9RHOB
MDDDCYIQQFVDHDPGPGAMDFSCGTLSYDGHTGTDYALPYLTDMTRGVTIVAAAPGVVRALRDGMPDQIVNAANRHLVKDKGCGNGVALVHADGWETQYCHLKRGSILVEQGQQVTAGTALGQVGLSGNTQFPHLELVVRRNGKIVDPFAPASPSTRSDTGCSLSGPHLWKDLPHYTPGGLIGAGFANKLPTYDDIKSGRANQITLTETDDALVLWGYAYGGQAGDVLRLTIDGPDGPFASHVAQLEKSKAQFFRATGKRRRVDVWPTGRYLGSVTMTRNGTLIDRTEVTLTLP